MSTPVGHAASWLPLITRYYDACTRADVDVLMEVLHPDVVHWFLAPNVGSRAVRGNEHLARYWRKVAGMIEAVWVVDSIVESGEHAVIEWTMFWHPADAPPGTRVATRGSEWFDLLHGRIHEIRSYYQQQPFSTELDGFPYAERGYSTVEQPASALHHPPGPDVDPGRGPLGL